jgi:hypothetical protein
MLAIPLDLRVAAVLAWANAQRALLDLGAVDDLVAGVRLHPWACPLCRTVGAGAPDVLQPEFSGTRLRVWRRGTNLLHLDVDAPPVVVAWSEEFDRGGHGRYAVKGGA